MRKHDLSLAGYLAPARPVNAVQTLVCGCVLNGVTAVAWLCDDGWAAFASNGGANTKAVLEHWQPHRGLAVTRAADTEHDAELRAQSRQALYRP